MAGLGGGQYRDFLAESIIGIDFDVKTDLSGFNGDSFDSFKQDINRSYWNISANGRSKGSISITNRQLWQFACQMEPGDLVITQNGKYQEGAKVYMIGRIVSEYKYLPDAAFPHVREVEWLECELSRHTISPEFNNYLRSGTTIVDLTDFTSEIESILTSESSGAQESSNSISNSFKSSQSRAYGSESRTGFALESHLEEYMVRNWDSIEFGKNYDIYSIDGVSVGQQFQVDTGNIDILAISKDKKEFLVVELKREKASDVVVGQIQRYMGYIKEEIVEPGQSVSGAIVALEDDVRIRRALSVTQNIAFYQYSIEFKLEKQ